MNSMSCIVQICTKLSWVVLAIILSTLLTMVSDLNLSFLQLAEYSQLEEQLRKTIANLDKRERQLAANEQEVRSHILGEKQSDPVSLYSKGLQYLDNTYSKHNETSTMSESSTGQSWSRQLDPSCQWVIPQL